MGRNNRVRNQYANYQKEQANAPSFENDLKYINDAVLTRLYNRVRDIDLTENEDNYRQLIMYYREFINMYMANDKKRCEHELRVQIEKLYKDKGQFKQVV